MKPLEESYQSQVVFFSDIKIYLRKIKIRALVFTCCVFVASSLFFLFKETRYVGKATFKEAGIKSTQGGSSLLKNLLLSTPVSQEGGVQAASIMKSRLLLEGLVKKLGLQVVFDDVSIIAKLKKRALDRWHLLRWGCLEDIKVPVIEVTNYPHEIVAHWLLIPKDENSFYIKTLDGKHIKEGFIGEWVDFEGASFKICQMGSLKERHFQMLPMEVAIDHVLKRLKVKAKKDDPDILDLQFEHRDRHLSAKFLNHLMAHYKEYLALDSERISKEQLKYLAYRQEEIAASLEDTFTRHAEYLKDHLDARGYISIQEEIHVKEALKKELDQKLDEITTALDMLKYVSFEHPSHGIKDDKIEALMQRWQEVNEEQHSYLVSKLKLQDLSHVKLKKQALKVPFRIEGEDKPFGYKKLTHILEEHVRKPLSELHHFTQLKDQVDKLLHVSEHAPLDRDSDLFKEVIQRANLDGSLEIKREHLKKLQSLLEMKLAAVEQRLFKRAPIALEHDSLNLETARQLFLDYTHQLDAAQIKTKQLEFCLEEIHHNTFEASAFPEFLSDAVTHEMVLEAAKLQKQLLDPYYSSTKDHVRLDKALKKEKAALSHHLKQIQNLLSLEKELCLEKMSSLHDVMISLLEEEKALLQQQLKSSAHAKTLALQQSKKLFEAKSKQLYENMADIPAMWIKEQTLELKKRLNISMMEAMTQLIESKNVDLHFTEVESKPLDMAFASFKPKEDHALLIASMIAILLGFGFVALSSFAEVFKGLPVSLEALEFRGRLCVHEFKNQVIPNEKISLKKEIIEGLRKVAAAIMQLGVNPTCVGIVLRDGNNYVHHLARLLHRSGKKVLIIPLGSVLQKAIRQAFEEEVKASNYVPAFDVWIQENAEGYTAEMLMHPMMREKLSQFKRSYDVTIIATSEGVKSALAERLLTIADHMVITMSDETLEELQAYLRWDDEKPYKALCFIRHD